MSTQWDRVWDGRDIGVTPARRMIFKIFDTIPLSSGAKVLDVGCGSGTLATYWEKRGCDITGLDFSDRALELTSKKSIKVIKGVATWLPFHKDTFDLVYSDGLLEHFIDPKPILREIFRVSKGYVISILPRNTLYNFIHNIVFRVPKEYKRSDIEWLWLHQELNWQVKYKVLIFGLLVVVCQPPMAKASGLAPALIPSGEGETIGKLTFALSLIFREAVRSALETNPQTLQENRD